MMMHTLRPRASSFGALRRKSADPSRTVEIPRYVFDERCDSIGSGSFADVFKATDTSNNTIVAIKRARAALSPCANGGSLHNGREVAAMMHLKHENIVRMMDSYMDGSLHIVYEFAEHGALFGWTLAKYDGISDKHRPVVSARTLGRIARQTGKALAYCHKNHVAQCDFKLDNVIVVRAEPDIVVKIVDFGLCFGVYYAESAENTTSEKAGSVEYAAPEVLTSASPHDPYKADVWSYGISLYTVAHHYYPWCASQAKTVFRNPPDLSEEIETHVQDGMRGIIASALNFCAGDRPTMAFLADDERISEDEMRDTFTIHQIIGFDVGARDSDDDDIPLPPPIDEDTSSYDSVIIHRDDEASSNTCSSVSVSGTDEG